MRRLLGLLVCGACAAPPTANDAGPTPWWQTSRLRACADVPSAPIEHISDVVRRVNELPGVVDVPCVVASLPRPLSVVASRSVTSAQPSASDASPRIFLLSSTLVLSVVPEGEGARLLEMGEYVSSLDTLKGELALPADGGVVGADAPYAHLHHSPTVSTCGFCHRAEAPHPSIAGAYVSRAFRPEPRSLIGFQTLRGLHESCDAGASLSRCELFAAVFGFGPVDAGAFPSNLELFAP